MPIQISWLLQKPIDLDLHYLQRQGITDLDLHCLQRQGISRFSRTRVKMVSSAKNYLYHIICFHGGIRKNIISGQSFYLELGSTPHKGIPDKYFFSYFSIKKNIFAFKSVMS